MNSMQRLVRLLFFVGLLLPCDSLFPDEPERKLDPPPASELAEATKLLNDVYGSEVAAAKTAEQKREFAAKIIKIGRESQKDPIGRFVLLRLANNIAVQAGAAETAIVAIDELNQGYNIDPIELKSDALRKCAALATTPAAHDTVAQLASTASDEAVSQERFALAVPLSEFATIEAKKAKDDALVSELLARRTEVAVIARAYEAVKIANKTLDTSPADPEANLVVGKFTCFMKRDWTRGLPMLERGSDPKLKTLAKEELRGVASSEEQAKLADAWWNAADGAKGLEKKQMQIRACYWYQSALPSLSGLARDKAVSRLQKMNDDLPTQFLADRKVYDLQAASQPAVQLTIHGQNALHAIWAHPPANDSSSHMAFQLNGRYHLLRGEAGIADTGQYDPRTPLTFRIMGDGKLLWKSPPLPARNSSAQFRLNIVKVKKLELFVDCPGANNAAWGIWVSPALER